MTIVKTIRLYRGACLLIAINALRYSVASAADRRCDGNEWIGAIEAYAALAGGPSQGGNAPGKGSDSGGWGSYRVSYFANPKAPRIDEAQFSAHVSRFC